MDKTEILYYVLAIGCIIAGFWGIIDAIKQMKNNK